MVRPAAIVGRGHAVPRVLSQRRLWDEFFAEHYQHDPVAAEIFERSGVQTRHGVADPVNEDVSQWSTEQRMQRFVSEALPLGRTALSRCLTDAGIDASDVGQLTVVSCTGYATPGLDILLARDLEMSEDTERLHIGHMGCYAALPALATLSDSVAARDKLGLLVCVELTSLHLQPAVNDQVDLEQVVAHALFGDAAAAVAVAPDAPGLEVVDVLARTDVDHAGAMTWDVTDLGFRIGLSPKIPELLAGHVDDAVRQLLDRNGLAVADVTGWAIHPGGPRIIDVVADRLGLDEQAVAPSRAILNDYGNCSSGTILVILDRLMADGLGTGDAVVALAFGPGLTLYATLLTIR